MTETTSPDTVVLVHGLWMTPRDATRALAAPGLSAP